MRNCHSREIRVLVLLAGVIAFFKPPIAKSQQTPDQVSIQVRFNQSQGPLRPIWNYFGYDEPNYTYAPNGKKLLGELAALDSEPVYVRVHNLLTSGDGSASLKWGSTNVYTEDASGHPIYSWEILDHIFDTFRGTGIKPLVEIGFMPEALSIHPHPYRHHFPHTSDTGIYTGWAYPPKDYAKWSDLVYQFVRHLRQRYGDAEVTTWLWEVWNEPDIGYWQGTREEFFKLYDFTVESVFRAFPEATRSEGPTRLARAIRNLTSSSCILGSLRTPEELRQWEDRIASRLHQLSSQGIPAVAERPRSDGNQPPTHGYR